jgi:predicted small secreted protein
MAKKAMLLALVLLAAGLIAGCSGGEDESDFVEKLTL